MSRSEPVFTSRSRWRCDLAPHSPSHSRLFQAASTSGRGRAFDRLACLRTRPCIQNPFRQRGEYPPGGANRRQTSISLTPGALNLSRNDQQIFALEIHLIGTDSVQFSAIPCAALRPTDFHLTAEAQGRISLARPRTLTAQVSTLRLAPAVNLCGARVARVNGAGQEPTLPSRP